MQPSDAEITIDIPTQRLVLRDEKGRVRFEAPVSTSRYGVGSEPGSFRTPTGRFRIAEKIGEETPPWAVFVGRKWTGAFGDATGGEDQILSRILWLEGLDPENANTRERYIYLHGTNAEHCIGTPASIGCIRLRNAEMIVLFDLVEIGTRVLICPGPLL